MMEEVKRVCPVCGAANPLEGRVCVKCGADMRRNLPTVPEVGLPMPWQRLGATLVLGAAALALEVGLKLLQHRLPGTLRRLFRQEPSWKEQVEDFCLYGERVWELRRHGARLWSAERFLWHSTRR